MQVVVFHVAGASYALPIEEVREVVPHARPRPLPAESPWELGVVSIRGTVVRVWELATRLGLEPGEAGALVVVAEEPPLGLVVEKVVGLREIADGALAPMGYWPDALGVLSDGDELVVVLDPAQLFRRAAANRLDALSTVELKARARAANVPGRSRMSREQLIEALRATP